MNVPIPTYSGHENSSRGLKAPTVERYARFFQVSPEWMLFGRGLPRPGVPAPKEDDDGQPIPPGPLPPSNLAGLGEVSSGSGRLPIRGRAGGAPNGHLIMSGDDIGSAPMPRALDGVPGAYGAFVHGDSMLERFRNGELTHVHPHRPVAKDDDVVAQIRDEEGSVFGYVKRFVSRSPRQLVLKQLNPPEGESELMRFPGDAVVSVHKIVGTGEP